MSHRRSARGFTFVELLCTIFLLTILAGVAMPVAYVMEKRARELELRQELRTMRRALDAYHFTVLIFKQQGVELEEGIDAAGWPEELEILVEGVDNVASADSDKTLKFLRRIPKDPMTGEAEWGMRSAAQDPDDNLWDGTHVFDVYSLADGEGLDGTEYSTW